MIIVRLSRSTADVRLDAIFVWITLDERRLGRRRWRRRRRLHNNGLEWRFRHAGHGHISRPRIVIKRIATAESDLIGVHIETRLFENPLISMANPNGIVYYITIRGVRNCFCSSVRKTGVLTMMPSMLQYSSRTHFRAAAQPGYGSRLAGGPCGTTLS